MIVKAFWKTIYRLIKIVSMSCAICLVFYCKDHFWVVIIFIFWVIINMDWSIFKTSYDEFLCQILCLNLKLEKLNCANTPCGLHVVFLCADALFVNLNYFDFSIHEAWPVHRISTEQISEVYVIFVMWKDLLSTFSYSSFVALRIYYLRTLINVRLHIIFL